mgnify:CR=1 FL=1
MNNTRLSVPASATKGDVIEIKALIQHPMESGFRRNSRGVAVPRDIITRFECDYDGETVFAADFNPSVSANPFLTFYTVATASGTLSFRWIDQDGKTWTDTAEIEVQ